jgi:sulfite oxidase
MNGKLLTPEHGAPIRTLFPGILGARSVKWLDCISVQLEESNNHYMQRDYKVLPPEAEDTKSAEKYWDKVPPMLDMPINSVIASPKSGCTIHRDQNGCVEVRGYALPGGMDGPIRRVMVTPNEGKSWYPADLAFGDEDKQNVKRLRWAWCLWKAWVPMKPGSEQHVMSQAEDFAGNKQQKQCDWNLRGVGYNAWGKVNGLKVI